MPMMTSCPKPLPTQLPAWQMPLAQTWPHAPQFLSSLNLLMQLGPHGSSGASHRERHLYVPCSPQIGVGSMHRVAQSPQCSAVLKGGVHAEPSSTTASTKPSPEPSPGEPSPREPS